MKRVIVIGGGASGLVAAIVAARRGAKVTILEKNSSCGKKILVTGNGKCNYYNRDQDIRHYHSSNMEIISNMTNEVNMKMVLDFFDSVGVIPKIKNGYYYPYSNQAVSILNAFLIEASCLGVKIINNVMVKNVIKKDYGFVIETDGKDYYGDKVIMATGSYAYYKDKVNSYDMADNLGHRIIKPRPALVQLVVDDKIVKDLAGVRSLVNITLYQNNKKIREEEGEILFTSYGISGICAMQVSRDIAIGLDNGCKEEVVINFVYDKALKEKEFIEFLDNYSKQVGKRNIRQIFDNILNYKLGNAIIKKFKIDGDSYWENLDYKDKVYIASKIVSFRLEIKGTNSFKESQVCSGGVSLEDINIKTMESLKVKDLYIVGEMLDVDGDCGGYNLSFAWLSGILAGISSVRDEDDD